MGAPATGALLGILLTILWALAGIWWVLLAVLLAAAGALAGMIAEGRIDLARLLGHEHDDDSTASSTNRTNR